jgi:nucleotide-binding universal stress UspA family protein
MKVLVPVDGSENSMRAVSYVSNMVKTHPGMEVTLLAVACLFEHYIGETVLNLNEINEDCRKRFSLKLDEAKNYFADRGISVNAVLMTGEPADVIIDYVEKNGINKIIIGSRGLGLFKAAVMGSVTYKVLHNVKIPVTVIK